MPNRDHTGPHGQGAMTGRQLGDCARRTQEAQFTRPRYGMQQNGGRGRRLQGQARRFQNRLLDNE